MQRTVLITGASGLIGGEVVTIFADRGWKVVGVDNNMRRHFFGEGGDTRLNAQRLLTRHSNYILHEIDIRSRDDVSQLVRATRPSALVHAAAQPSHDLAASRPFEDFDVNAGGTLNLLEAARVYAPESPFVFLSTNKVYGDTPNHLPFVEMETRFEFAPPLRSIGISEDLGIDNTLHSLFGVSKTAADLLVQEYGRYFGLPTTSLRGGCLTGGTHAGVELHGFLSYLTRCIVQGSRYTIYGYKGKQVRDNIHAMDVARLIAEVIERPKVASVYNIGGGYENAASIVEAAQMIEAESGRRFQYDYVGKERVGDHRVYYTDLSRVMSDYPDWSIEFSLQDIVADLVKAWQTEAAG